MRYFCNLVRKVVVLLFTSYTSFCNITGLSVFLMVVVLEFFTSKWFLLHVFFFFFFPECCSFPVQVNCWLSSHSALCSYSLKLFFCFSHISWGRQPSHISRTSSLPRWLQTQRPLWSRRSLWITGLRWPRAAPAAAYCLSVTSLWPAVTLCFVSRLFWSMLT